VDCKLFTLQGLLPERRREVVANIARTIEQELLSVNDISEVLAGLDWRQGIEHKITTLIDQRINTSALPRLPLWRVINANLMPPFKKMLTQEIIKIMEGFQADLLQEFRQRLDLHEIVSKRMDRFSLQQLENVVLKVAHRELRHIELVGAILGFLIGVTQVGLMVLL